MSRMAQAFASFRDLSPYRGEIKRGAIQAITVQQSPHPNPPPNGEGISSAGLLRRLRLLAMTMGIALLPAVAFACSGHYYDPNAQPVVTSPTTAEHILEIILLAINSSTGKTITTIILFFVLYLAWRKKISWLKVAIIFLLVAIISGTASVMTPMC